MSQLHQKQKINEYKSNSQNMKAGFTQSPVRIARKNILAKAQHI